MSNIIRGGLVRTSIFNPDNPGPIGGDGVSGTPSTGRFTELYSNGSRVPYVLCQSGIAFILLSSGTMGNNGALTGITALPIAYTGAYVYLPANAIFSGSTAGWYWCSFSSTTAGTVYNSTYTTGQPAVGTPTPFVSTGPGAFTGAAAGIQGPTITLPANAMGANGSIRIRSMLSATNNANLKVFYWRLGTSIMAPGATISTLNSSHIATIYNRGVSSRQIGEINTGAYYGVGTGSTAARLTSTVDTTAAVSVNFYISDKAVATDNYILEAFSVEVLPCA